MYIDELGGIDPYSASKSCAEILTSSYRDSFFKKRHQNSTARAGNVIGGGDWSEDRLIPDIVKALEQKKTALIRNPYSIRPWQHVLEPLYGYLLLAKTLYENKNVDEAWNFGPSDDGISVKQLLYMAKQSWNIIHYEVQEEMSSYHETHICASELIQSPSISWMETYMDNTRSSFKLSNGIKLSMKIGKL